MANHFVAFWNVENFFAPENCQERPDWLASQMASALDGWSEELFLRKRDQLAQIITQMNGGAGPDILGVCEVENRLVLDALCSRLNQQLPERDYAPVHADSLRDLRGIDTAFLHDCRRYTHDPESLFSYFVVRRTGTRDITQATITTSSGVNLVLLCNHWPARSGGIHESRGYRMTAGETLAYFHQRIRDKEEKNVRSPQCTEYNDAETIRGSALTIKYNQNVGRLSRLFPVRTCLLRILN